MEFVNTLRKDAESSLRLFGFNPADRDRYFQAKTKTANVRRRAARVTTFWQPLAEQTPASNLARGGLKVKGNRAGASRESRVVKMRKNLNPSGSAGTLKPSYKSQGSLGRGTDS